jgi:hypothetical protein
MTCDKYLRAIRGFASQWNKYMGFEVPVTVVGFSQPNFTLPPNFNFISLGKQQYFPVDKWSDGLIQLLKYHMEPGEIFGLLLEDYWLVQPAKVQEIRMLYDYMHQFRYVLKMDLCSDRQFAKGATPYGACGHIPLVKSDYNSEYHMSLMAGLWSRDLLLELNYNGSPFLKPGESPWDLEMWGTPRLAAFEDKVLVLGTTILPLKHALVFRNGDPGKYRLDDLSEDDKDNLKGLGYAE